ncbi:MAG: TraR/DksA family transcriptional regulator [Candidatus Methylomirabilia bacterium]
MAKPRRHKAALRSLSEAELRQTLLAKQRELRTSIRQQRGGLREAGVDLAVDSLGDQAERPVLTPEAEMDYEVIDQRARLLTQVNHALKKLDKGSYGRCENCEEPILPARLRALPFAVRCTRCQEIWERERQRVEGRVSAYASTVADD